MFLCFFVIQKHQLEGRKQGLEDEIRKLKRELKDDMFKNADKDYRDKMISLRVSPSFTQCVNKHYKFILVLHRIIIHPF